MVFELFVLLLNSIAKKKKKKPECSDTKKKIVAMYSVKEEETGLRWKFTSKLEDLDFTDDVALISPTQRHVQLKTNRLAENAESTGPWVNVGKCKVMRVNARNNKAITVNGLSWKM